jgi:hypothetical protein
MGKNNKEDYSIGYGKPPRHTQFKPGQSGNASGRPKKSPAIAEVISKHLHKRVSVNVGNEIKKIQMLEAILMKVVSKAASGDLKSAEFILNLLNAGGKKDRNDNLPQLLEQFRALDAKQEADRSAPHRATSIDPIRGNSKKKK